MGARVSGSFVNQWQPDPTEPQIPIGDGWVAVGDGTAWRGWHPTTGRMTGLHLNPTVIARIVANDWIVAPNPIRPRPTHWYRR